jgi:hypothetical protein
VVRRAKWRNMGKMHAMPPCTMYLVQGKWYFKKIALLGLFICVLYYFKKNILTLRSCRDHIWVIFSYFMVFLMISPLLLLRCSFSTSISLVWAHLSGFLSGWHYLPAGRQEWRLRSKNDRICMDNSYGKQIFRGIWTIQDETKYTWKIFSLYVLKDSRWELGGRRSLFGESKNRGAVILNTETPLLYDESQLKFAKKWLLSIIRLA